ncbi:MAG TPA: hypothetical protein VFO98_10450 [Marmoricola sp.]|nr:hypothetical protein [Marmoricola sp.]
MPVSLLAVVALIAALIAGAAGTHDPAHADGHSASHPGQHAATPVMTEAQLAFHDQMRKLWEDHVTWTRLAIVTFADGSDGFGETAGRLLQNQVDLGDALKPFYGTAAGDRLTALLRDHILIAVDVLTAAKNGDGAAFDAANARWYANGDDVADLISSLDPPAWPRDEVRAMMKTHLDQTLAEAAAELGGDYAASVASYEDVHQHMLDMADMLSAGIMARFPASFRP